METMPIFAHEVENNDFIRDDAGNVLGYVYSISDDVDNIVMDVVDDDGDHTSYTYGPFDVISVVTSFDEPVDF